MTKTTVLRKSGIGSVSVRARGISLDDVVAIGHNDLGGGIDNRGTFIFTSLDDVRTFLDDAPISRSVVIF